MKTFAFVILASYFVSTPFCGAQEPIEKPRVWRIDGRTTYIELRVMEGNVYSSYINLDQCGCTTAYVKSSLTSVRVTFDEPKRYFKNLDGHALSDGKIVVGTSPEGMLIVDQDGYPTKLIASSPEAAYAAMFEQIKLRDELKLNNAKIVEDAKARLIGFNFDGLWHYKENMYVEFKTVGTTVYARLINWENDGLTRDYVPVQKGVFSARFKYGRDLFITVLPVNENRLSYSWGLGDRDIYDGDFAGLKYKLKSDYYFLETLIRASCPEAQNRVQ